MVATKKAKQTKFSSVLVAVDGDAADDEAVRLASELLGGQKGRLHIVYVIEVDRGLPVDAEIAHATARGDEVLKHMEEVAKPYKCEIQADLLQSRRAGLAVVREAVEKRVDAIVLGVPYMEVYGSFSIGDTASYVLKNAPCCVILRRSVMPQAAPMDGHRH